VEAVEVVRRFNDPHEGEDVMPAIRDLLQRLGPDPAPDQVLAAWAQDPSWRHAHPEIEWDTSGIGGLGAAPKGPSAISDWWAEWTEAWKTYTYKTVLYRDLGEWVLTESDVEATGPADVDVKMRVFQIWKVQDDKVITVRVFLDEAEAVAAAAG
jgi:limonene-1,2-epoxide hydrolase